jgi:hypothetical protein
VLSGRLWPPATAAQKRQGLEHRDRLRKRDRPDVVPDLRGEPRGLGLSQKICLLLASEL